MLSNIINCVEIVIIFHYFVTVLRCLVILLLFFLFLLCCCFGSALSCFYYSARWFGNLLLRECMHSLCYSTYIISLSFQNPETVFSLKVINMCPQTMHKSFNIKPLVSVNGVETCNHQEVGYTWRLRWRHRSLLLFFFCPCYMTPVFSSVESSPLISSFVDIGMSRIWPSMFLKYCMHKSFNLYSITES